ncbi:MAG: hypothetical protein U0T84_07445 [Chitinophagales bacterium]
MASADTRAIAYRIIAILRFKALDSHDCFDSGPEVFAPSGSD